MHLRLVVTATLIVFGVAALAVSALGWHLSSLAMHVDTSIHYDSAVLSVDGSTVTFSRSTQTARAGEYGLLWPQGNAIVGSVVRGDTETVTRTLKSSNGQLTAGQKVSWLDEVWTTDPKTALSIDFQNVSIPTSVGAMPTWFIPGNSDTWVIVLHGRGGGLTSALRVLPALQTAGNPILVVSQRNDVGAPKTSGGKTHLGASEWHDLDDAITYARQHGAAHVVLYGGSTGGAVVAETYHESASAGLISGLILDSPVLDWRNTLDYQAGKRHVPLFVTRIGEQFLSWRTGLNFGEFNQVKRAKQFNVPVLLTVGSDDDVVPVGPAKAFAAALPDVVTFDVFNGAGHAENWNVDSQRYDEALTSFLSKV